jgi:tRNA pseudouridine32 synthase/23S rRNA pseudouridine746 synthase
MRAKCFFRKEMYSIIEDHKDFLLIDKHPGVSFHKDKEGEGLVSRLKQEPGIGELYTVHRLDRMTSGLLVFARNKESAKKLMYQFRDGHVTKNYLAISDGRPKKKQGLIKGDMEKSRRGTWKLKRTVKHPAVTQFFSYSMGGGLRLFILKPHTGKTHQIRVALKSIGAPVLGDPLYHRKEEGDKVPDRGYLHAYALRFRLNNVTYQFVNKPDSGRLFTTRAFLKTLKHCEKPWELKWPSLR